MAKGVGVMRNILFNPTALGGYGTIILTVVIFLAQKGFGKMIPLTSLYIIGLVIGCGLVLYSVLKIHSDVKLASNKGIESIVPVLEKMDSILDEDAREEAKRPIDVQRYMRLNNRKNIEILGIKPEKVSTPQEASSRLTHIQRNLAQKYNKQGKDKILEIAHNMSNALDSADFG